MNRRALLAAAIATVLPCTVVTAILFRVPGAGREPDRPALRRDPEAHSPQSAKAPESSRTRLKRRTGQLRSLVTSPTGGTANTGRGEEEVDVLRIELVEYVGLVEVAAECDVLSDETASELWDQVDRLSEFLEHPAPEVVGQVREMNTVWTTGLREALESEACLAQVPHDVNPDSDTPRCLALYKKRDAMLNLASAVHRSPTVPTPEALRVLAGLVGAYHDAAADGAGCPEDSSPLPLTVEVLTSALERMAPETRPEEVERQLEVMEGWQD